MTYKWIGALLIICGCGGFGFSLAIAHRRQENMLNQLIRVLEVMECELQYRLTQLPELCCIASEETGSSVRDILLEFSEELNRRVSPDPGSCMRKILSDLPMPSREIRDIFLELGRSLGRFDLDGQLKGLAYVRKQCEIQLASLQLNRTERIRCYQTLGLCAGAALVIMLV